MTDLEQLINEVLKYLSTQHTQLSFDIEKIIKYQQAKIKKLQKHVDDYERRVERLEDEAVGESDGTVFARGLFSGLRLAVEIMTEGE